MRVIVKTSSTIADPRIAERPAFDSSVFELFAIPSLPRRPASNAAACEDTLEPSTMAYHVATSSRVSVSKTRNRSTRKLRRLVVGAGYKDYRLHRP